MMNSKLKKLINAFSYPEKKQILGYLMNTLVMDADVEVTILEWARQSGDVDAIRALAKILNEEADQIEIEEDLAHAFRHSSHRA